MDLDCQEEFYVFPPMGSGHMCLLQTESELLQSEMNQRSLVWSHMITLETALQGLDWQTMSLIEM